MIDPQFQNHIGNLGFVFESIKGGSYFGIFFISVFVSFVLPLPEVVALLLIGFAARTGAVDLTTALAISILGTIIGDNALYRLSFFGNKFVERFNRKMRANKLIQYEHLVADNIGKSIFFLRLVTGVRFFGPVISGTLGVRWRKFFPYNAAATILHSVLFVLIGFSFHRKIIPVIVEVEVVRNILLFSSVLIVGILLKIFSKEKKKNTA